MYINHSDYNMQDPGPRPASHLVWAILSTVLCCLPFGIVAIIKASSVDGLWNQGRYEEARKAARSARNFTLISILLPLLGIIIYLLLIAIGIGTISSLSDLGANDLYY